MKISSLQGTLGLLLIGVGTFAGASARGALIDFQIQGYNSSDGDSAPPAYSGAAAIGSSGDVWNGVPINSGTSTTYGATNLKLVDGTTSTSVGLSVSSGDAHPLIGSDYIRPGQGSFVSALQNAYIDGDSTGGSNGIPKLYDFTISGLTSGQTYSVYFYSQAGPYGTNHTTFTVTSPGTPIGPSSGTADSTGTSTFTQNDNYVLLKFTPSGTSISGTVQDTSSNFIVWNGLQIQGSFAPEPASATLLGLGGFGLLMRRRRA